MGEAETPRAEPAPGRATVVIGSGSSPYRGSPLIEEISAFGNNNVTNVMQNPMSPENSTQMLQSPASSSRQRADSVKVRRTVIGCSAQTLFSGSNIDPMDSDDD